MAVMAKPNFESSTPDRIMAAAYSNKTSLPCNRKANPISEALYGNYGFLLSAGMTAKRLVLDVS